MSDTTVIAAMARDAVWLNANACAFLLCLMTPKGGINRRGFLEHYANRESFPKAWKRGREYAWKREEVIRWAEDEARIKRAA